MAKKIDVAAMEELANKGNGFAQLIMGDIYRDGIDALNVSQDSAKSFGWYQKAANQDFMSAQHNLGVMYSNGHGVRQDYAKAFEWFQKAANQGDTDAQYSLGVMYSNGRGVRQDYIEAKEWFGKACDNGDQMGCDSYRELNN